jgi:hypothetical protein
MLSHGTRIAFEHRTAMMSALASAIFPGGAADNNNGE